MTVEETGQRSKTTTRKNIWIVTYDRIFKNGTS